MNKIVGISLVLFLLGGMSACNVLSTTPQDQRGSATYPNKNTNARNTNNGRSNTNPRATSTNNNSRYRSSNERKAETETTKRTSTSNNTTRSNTNNTNSNSNRSSNSRTNQSSTNTNANRSSSTSTTTRALAERPNGTYDKNVPEVVNIARNYTGTPYRSGGNDRNGIDCSGLICQVYSELGVKVPRISWQQSEFGTEIDKIEHIKPGDWLFFVPEGGTEGYVSHSGIVTQVNGDKDIVFIHASTSRGVIEDNLFSKYFRNRFVKAMRPF